ncbi:glycosyltransferase [Vibrio parahaemolyticus]|uniref:glycosyltransferase n=1 Tax=Vibrio parahaemolyticus TaxID=670 RepID=UPI00111EBB3F|nr:glycosyltransferase [Vibrio parahaemolyticus]EIA1621126.1 glycosyltransferase [Vibrio parahaemolyticus]EIU6868205.1 glycosyltransferase [Vibrio parahaemolyticus]EIV8632581.1 glycosyltransferase [Vibrio parahaemolyticus]EIZ1446308.1 glycosyltransferase [Vibrio parahaemolyticus]EJF4456824.1 glycosyltransferase [Vibrio parahaemolyticus]
MLKVAHIITKSEIGGAQTWVKDQISLLDKDFEHFLVTNKPGWLSDRVSVQQTLFVPGIEKKFCLKTLFKLVHFVRSNKIDILIASSANAGVYARLLKLFTGCRVIYVSHGWSCIYNGGRLKKLFITVERLLSYLSDSVLCVSEKDRQDAIDIIGIRDKKLAYIRNSVFPRNIVRKEESEIFRILFLGRLAKPKRPDILIEAIDDLGDVQLDIVGDGPLKRDCKQTQNVNFVGAVSDFDDFGRYDLFALVSDSEGLPMSALEAASAGVPLLLSNVGGCSELINGNGVLVDNHPDEIATKLQWIKSNYKAIKEQALHSSAEFDIRNYRDSYISIYTGRH